MENKKKCTQCKQVKSIAEFIKLNVSSRHSMSDPCRKQYAKSYNRRRKVTIDESKW